MKGKVLGVITSIIVMALVSGAIVMNVSQQSNYNNKHRLEAKTIAQDMSYSARHLHNPRDDQEAF